MNKTELIAEVAKKCGMSKKDAEKAVTTTFDTITEALSQGDKVQLVGFGGFETKKREARMGRNPKTGEEIERPCNSEQPFSALVYKTIADPFVGKLSLFKVMSGTATGSGNIYNASCDKTEKVTGIYVLRGKKQISTQLLHRLLPVDQRSCAEVDVILHIGKSDLIARDLHHRSNGMAHR